MIENTAGSSEGNPIAKTDRIESLSAISIVSPAIGEEISEGSIEPKIRSNSDPALRFAWERLIQYDRAAFSQKQQHIRIRAMIVVLSFLSSLIAVAVASKEDWYSTTVLRYVVVFIPITTASIIGYQQKKWRWYIKLAVLVFGFVLGIVAWLLSMTNYVANGMHDLLQFLVFLFALVASGLLAYATQFIPSELWAKYRFSAEMIRRHIYLYRIQAGDYFEKSTSDQQTLLMKQVDEADRYCPTPVSLFVSLMREKREDEFLRAILDVDGDNGFEAIPVNDYIEKRLTSQYNWYVEKSFSEYRQMRRLQTVSIIIGGVGSLLVFRGYAPWVAVTTVAAVSVNVLAGLSMYGRTYSIYLKAADKLQHLYLNWKLASKASREDPKYVADFVHSVELGFKEEIDLWIQQVEKSVAEIEQEFSHKLPQNLGISKAEEKR